MPASAETDITLRPARSSSGRAPRSDRRSADPFSPPWSDPGSIPTALRPGRRRDPLARRAGRGWRVPARGPIRAPGARRRRPDGPPRRGPGRADRRDRTPRPEMRGGAISPEMEPPKLLWLRENGPKPFDAACAFLDLPTWRAAGGLARSARTVTCRWTTCRTRGAETRAASARSTRAARPRKASRAPAPRWSSPARRSASRRARPRARG